MSRLTLRTKLIIAFLLIALMPVIVLTVINNYVTRVAITDNAAQTLLRAATQTARSFDDFIKTNSETVTRIAQLPLITQYLDLPPEARADSVLEIEVEALLLALGQESVSSYALLDSQGKTLVDTVDSDHGLDRSTREYFKVVKQTGQSYVSPVLFSLVTGEPSLYFSSPVFNRADEFVGVLRIRYRADSLQDLLLRHNSLAGPQSFGILLDENYIHLAHSTAPETIFQAVNALDPQILAELQSARRLPNLPSAELSTDLPNFEQKLNNIDQEPIFTAEDVATDDKINQMAAARLQSKTLPWLVIYAQPEEAFLSPIQAQTNTALIIAALMAIIVIGAAISGTHLLAAPITRLTTVAEQMIAGNLDVQARVEAQDEIGQLALAFNEMTERLRSSINVLEDQVADRTQGLALMTRISERLIAILDLDDLLFEIVDQIKEKFGYYHTHIYLLDEEARLLRMVEGTGEAGATMKARNHAISLREPSSLVARAAREGEVVRINNVSQLEQWLANASLPNTRSEMAVPILLEGSVVGVLDVQEDSIDAFDESDESLLRSLANQVAIAIRNARLFAQVEKTLAEAQRAYDQYVTQSWQKGNLSQAGYHFYIKPNGPTPDETKQRIITSARNYAAHQPGISQLSQRDDDVISETITAPIQLGQQQIGTLQIHSFEQAKVWSQADLNLVEVVLTQLSEMAEKLRLFEETRSRASQEQTIREITEQLRGAPSMEQMLEIAVTELGERLSATHVRLDLGIQSDGETGPRTSELQSNGHQET